MPLLLAKRSSTQNYGGGIALFSQKVIKSKQKTSTKRNNTNTDQKQFTLTQNKA